MSTSISHGEIYPGCDFSLSQILHAAKRKLQNPTFGGGVTLVLNQSEVDSLVQEASTVLALVRSVKDSFAPINRIPPEVLSLIPDYFARDPWDHDRDLIALTHVCRSWRDTLTSRSSLWTQLDFTNIDKTLTYIQRSHLSSLEVNIHRRVIDNPSAPVIPHIRRVNSLTIWTKEFPRVLEYFPCHVPLLEKVEIFIDSTSIPVPSNAFLNGDFSTLRELRVCQGVTYFPWKNLKNLQVLSVRHPNPRYTVAHFLSVLESAPLLHTVKLDRPTKGPSDAPSERIVPLRHLKVFTIDEDSSPSALLHHLHIPKGASLVLKFNWDEDEETPLLNYLPEGSPNSHNLSHVTAINIWFDFRDMWVRLSGPSGSLRVLTHWPMADHCPSYEMQCELFHSLHPIISTTERLAISWYDPADRVRVEHCPIFKTLSSANQLRTLVLK